MFPLTFALSIFLTFSVFAFGAVENWSSAICEGSLFTLAAIVAWTRKDFLRIPSTLWAPFLFAAALAAAAALQLIPIPASWWRWTGDERATMRTEALEAEKLLRSKAYRTEPFSGLTLPEDTTPIQTPPSTSWIPVSFVPTATVRGLWALLAAIGLIMLLECLGRDNSALRALALVSGLLGVLVGLIAMAQFRPGVTKVLGFRESAHAGGAFGPFINENNGMGFVNVALCLLYFLAWRRFRRENKTGNRLGLVILILVLAAFQLSLLLIRTTGAGWWTVLLFPVVLLAHSFRSFKKTLLAAAVVSVALGAGTLLWAIQHDLVALHGRTVVWRNALSKGHWWAGNGLNTFAERFPAILMDMPTDSPKRWLYPENEYIQLAFEAGTPSLVLALGIVAYVIVLGAKAILSKGPAFILIPALWGEGLHAFTDFSLHLWPVATAILILIAILEFDLARRSASKTAFSELRALETEGSHDVEPSSHHNAKNLRGSKCFSFRIPNSELRIVPS